jgi:hypothetical protein
LAKVAATPKKATKASVETPNSVAASAKGAAASEARKGRKTAPANKATTSAAAKRNGTGAKAGAGPLPTLQILDTRVLRGANYWSRQPVVKMLVDLGVLEQYPTTKIPGFIDGLLAWIPSLEDHACSLNRRGGFVTRLKDGTWMGHVSEHIALELQNLAGTPVHHGKTRGAGTEGHYNVIYEFGEESVGLAAGQLAVRIVNHLVAPNDPAQALDYIEEQERLTSAPR